MTTSTIVCLFLNQTDTSIKSCTISYGQCGEVPAYTSWKNSTVESPNLIALAVDYGSLDCYEVTARSGTTIVIVEGKRVAGEYINIIIIHVIMSIAWILLHHAYDVYREKS